MLEQVNFKNEISFDKFGSLKTEKKCLYIVSTPIGNLLDISYRALFIMDGVDYILSEDTRKAQILLDKYGIKTKLLSYYSVTEKSKLNRIITMLKDGNSLALISEAGTPCISDPGSILINECIKENINIKSVPGASALTHSLVLCGFPVNRYYFQGFLPVKKGREKTFIGLKKIMMPVVIYESKYRIKKTLSDCHKYFGNREVSICRELSKKFEEVVNINLGIVVKNLSLIKEKGEFVIIVNNC